MSIRRRIIPFILWTVSVASVTLIGGATIHNIISPDSKPITTSIAVNKAAPREVKYTEVSNDGDLIVHYTNGDTDNAGHVAGTNGEGKYPTDQQMDDALARYCANSRCDAKSPTAMDVVQALTFYCSETGICKGKDAPAVTAEQLAVSVADYCANGRCIGATGLPGANGTTADATVMTCVIRGTTAAPVRYLDWKYSLEPNTAYRDLYKLPTWAECTAPIDLRI